MDTPSCASNCTRLLLSFTCLAAAALAQQTTSSEAQANQISALNAELSAAAAGTGNPGRNQLLSRRSALLYDLIASDPAKALALALPQELAARVRTDAPLSALEVHGEWAGAAEAVVADDREHKQSRTQWYLRTPQGRLELYFAAQSPHQTHGPLSVRGMRSASRVAVVEISSQTSSDALVCLATGVQNIAVLMITTPGVPAFPTGFDATFLQQLFFGPSTGSLTTDSLNSFWQESSYGQTSATGQVFGPFALAQDYDPDHLWDLQAAAVNAADSAVDFTQFTRVVLLFPVQDSGASGWFGALSGLSTIGCGTISSPSKGDLTASTSWLPVYPYDETWAYLGLAAHELGHSLGINHDSTEDYGDVPLGALSDPGTLVEYGSLYSVMGVFYNQFNGAQPVLGQYSAEHKQVLTWLGAGDYQQVSSAGTYTLVPYESSSGLRALRVQRDAASGAWLWLEYRQPIGDIDSSLQFLSMNSTVFQGALIHYENPTLDSLHMYLLDFHPVSLGNVFYNAALLPGETWQDPYSLLSLKVTSATSDGLSVTVAYNPSCATFQDSPTAFPATGGTGTISVTAANNCSWTATAYTPWISFSGPASGQGNGTVQFVVAQNNATSNRSGTIWLDRQSAAVTQPASTVPLLIAPASGATGVSVTPTLSWSSLSGATTYDVYLGTSPSPTQIANPWTTSYTPQTPLTGNTVYYWRIVAEGVAANTSATGSFTTETPGPGVPVLVYPANGEYDVSLTPTLSWNAATGASSYDVYFGTSTAPPLVTNTTGTTYAPPPLTMGNYYWRVAARNAGGTSSSATWQFSPQLPLAAPNPLTPADGATGVSLTPTLTWSAAQGAASYWVFLGTSYPPPLVYDTKATSYSPGTLLGGTLYYWYLVSRTPTSTFTSVSRTFTTMPTASAPVLLSPAQGAAGVSLTPTLSWSGSNGATSYDVYLGTAASPPLVTNTTGTNYIPPALNAGTVYYWRVVGKNGSAAATSTTWSFTTQVAAPVLVTPASAATGIALTPALTWNASSGATSYDLYFGTVSPPPFLANTAARTYSPGTLAGCSVYYWKVVAKNGGGAAASAIWSFTTQMASPVLTAPGNAATGVSVTPALTWNAANGATSYDVYFGTAAIPVLVSNVTTTSFEPSGTLSGNTNYNWRVVAKNTTGSATSATWGFTTQVVPPPAPALTAPANAAVSVSLTPLLSWTASTGATSYDVYLGTSSPPALVTTVTGTSYTSAALASGTTCYWKIVAKNTAGSAASATWSFTTLLAGPALTSPASAAAGVSLTPALTWTAATGATSYDVYLSPSSSPTLATNTTGTTYTPASLNAGTVYYWRVVAKNSSNSATSTTWSFTTQIAAPVLVSPAANATAVSLTAALSWNVAAGATSYDVYFGTVSPPPLATNTTGRSYSAGTLAGGTVYYWRVAAKNSGGSVNSDIWSFTTQVAPPVMVAPANAATGVSVTPSLSWSASTGATSYDVYFGTAAAPALATNTTALTYAPPATLAGATKYYWQVVAKSATGSAAAAVWSFTTQAVTPPAPVLTAPANGAASVSATPTLSWGTSTGATSYDVYLGTASPPPLATNVAGTSFAVAAGKLPSGTTCYWQIVAKNTAGSASSAVWSFSTQVAAPVLASPASGATGVALTPTLSWGASTGATSYDVYFGSTSSPPLATNTTGTSYAPSALTAGTVYYWRIVAKNSGSTASSSTWSFTTQLAAPVLVAPAAGAASVGLTAGLSWNPSAGATSYDVYIGTTSPPPLKGNTTDKTYAPGTLLGGTLYYWQVVAKNSGGTASSAIWSFTTQVAAPVLTAPANAATGVSVTPTLSWGASTGATSYDVYFGTSAAPALATNTTATSYAPSATLTGMTKYYWQVVAKNAAGSASSAIWSFTSQAVAPPAPSLTAPANGATAVSVTPALSWAAATGATSYDVYLGTTSPPPLVTNTTSTGYSVPKLASGTTFYWQIVAKNSAGSGASAIWSFTTQVAAPVLTAPASAATGVSVTPTLSWNASTGATSYDVYFGTTPSPPLATNATTTSYAPSALTAGTAYYWCIVAKNSGSSATSSTWSFTTQIAAPVLVAPATGAASVGLTAGLSWNPSAGATSYDVYIGTASPPPLKGNTTDKTYAPGTLLGGTLYYWQVVAKNSGGTASSAIWSFTTQVAAPVLTAPASAATGVSVTPTLSWGASTGATSYDVYFGTSATPALATNTTALSYTPSATLTGMTKYYWQVVAKNAAGSASSAIWPFTSQAVAPPAPSLTAPANGATAVSVTPALSWAASTGATSYDVYLGTTSPPPLATNTTSTGYAVPKLASGTTFYWQIVAKNSAGSGASAIWSFTTQVAAPVLTAPASAATGVSVTPTLSWNASTGATSYDVYFGTAAAPALATNTTATSYAPSATLTGMTKYYWQVVAKNAAGSAASATWSFTTQAVAPPAPLLTAPANGAGAVSVTPALSWVAATGATSYDVYLGTVSPPPLLTNVTTTSYTATTKLPAGTTCYWQIVAKNTAGSGSSATWSFSTQLAAPVLTAPAASAMGVSLTPTLTWGAVTGATSYDVYFGTATAPLLAGNTTTPSYSPTALTAGTVYYWHVMAKNAGSSAASTTWSFTTQVAAPVLVAPATGAAGVSPTSSLSWNASAAATSYDVYFGTSTPPPLVGNTTARTYTPAALLGGTVYYWQVAAKNSGGSASSAIWSFTTAVAAPVLVAPANAATAVSVTPVLSWNASTGATSDDVYFGTSSSPSLATNTTATSYTPAALAGATRYYWHVSAKNGSGSADSATWSFTTLVVAPPAAVLTAPASGAAGVSPTPALSWGSATGATSYDVYFGTASPPPLVTTTTATGYAAAKQPAGTTCYWQIVAKNTAGSTGSAVWSFSTALAAPLLASPATGATGVSLTPTLSWGAVTGATSYDVYFGTASSPPLATNTTATSYAPSGAQTAGTLYYWRVVAKNSGSTAGSTTSSFTTQVAAPALVAPAASATGVSATTTLSWNASAAATSYDVYFGTSSPPPLKTNTTSRSYAPGTLKAGTVYYWQVAAKNSGPSASSAVWSFTTH